MTRQPAPLLPPRPETYPTDLTNADQWVAWEAVWQESKNKYSKVPYNAHTGSKASSTDPATWASFETAKTAFWDGNGRYAGLGFVLSEFDPFAGIDLDNAILTAGDGTKTLTPEAAKFVALLDSYTEVSPSGTGIRVFVRAFLPPGGRKRGDVEMYESGRFLTVTGRRWPGTPPLIVDRQTEVETMHREVFPVPVKPAGTTSAPDASELPTDDSELLELAYAAKNGTKLRGLYGGDTSGYPGASEADLALCSLLAFWCAGDAARMDRLFRSSGLMRAKWDRVHYGNGDTYGARTIQIAQDGCREWYTPRGSKAAKKKAAERREEARKVRSEAALSAPGGEGRSLPVIETNNRHLRDIAGDARCALIAANDPPVVFVRSGRLVRIETDEKGKPTIGMFGVPTLRHRLARVANWVSTSDDRGTVAVAPGETVVQDVLAHADFGFVPPLETIVTAPVVAPDGTLVTQPGYLDAARVYYYEPDPRPLPDTTPTPANIDAAKDLLLGKLLADFPFVTDGKDGSGKPCSASRAHGLALLLLPFVRPLISGNTPLHIIDAPTQGTGKSLLAETISSLFLGRKAASTPCPDRKDDDEWRKQITTALMAGPSHLWFDNLKYKLDSGTLAQVLTSAEWTDRLLGANTSVTLPVRCAWILTGNNIELDGDFPRRSLWIRLDARQERPEDRDADAFQIRDMDAFLLAERPRLIGAVITLLRAWLEAGRPEWTGKPVGSYIAWSRIVGGILDCVGVPGFLSNREELYERADPEREQWGAFVQQWHDHHGSDRVGVSDLATLAVEAGIIEDESRGSRNAFGRFLRAKEGAVFAGFAITKSGTKDRATQYRLNQRNQNESFPSYAGTSNLQLPLTPFLPEGTSNFQTKPPLGGLIHPDSFDSSSTTVSTTLEGTGEEEKKESGENRVGVPEEGSVDL